MKLFLLLTLAAVAAAQVCQMNNGFDISPGSNLKELGANTIGECCDACKTTLNCVAWVWEKKSKGCWLKSTTTPTNPNANLVSGFVKPSNTITGGTCPSVTSGQDYSPGSHDLMSIPKVELATCCNLCSVVPGCKAWVWTFAMTCFLKDSDTGRVPSNLEGIVSGLPTSTLPLCPAGLF